MRLDIHHHTDDATQRVIATALSSLIGKVSIMSAALDSLTREVAETRTAVGSVLALVTGMATQIRDLKDDPAALEALANDLDAQQADIAAAVAANTPTP